MRIIARGTLREFWKVNPEAEQALKSWFQEAKRAEWKNPAQVKEQYRNASVLGNGRIVFNICGNKYRLVVDINHNTGIVYVRFVGTHVEYDLIDARTV